MAFPWNRSYQPGERDEAPRRRRGRGRQARAEETRRQSARQEEERRRQRLAITVGAMLITVIVAIVAVGYYREFYQPPRVVAGQVNDVKFTMGDLVDRIRVLQGVNRYSQGGFVDLSIVPFEYLQDMLNAEILRQKAPLLGVTVTEEDVTEEIRRRFYPTAPEGQEIDTGQLDQEFESNYSTFRTATGLSDKEYRVLVREDLLRIRMMAWLGQGIPDAAEQVEVEWIRLQPNGPVVPDDVKKRLEEGEEFSAVAAEVSTPRGFANREGYVGWVPQKAFPTFDPLLFGDAEREVEPLAVGEISDPIFTQQDGIFIIRKLSGPEERDLSDLMRFKLNQELFKEWQQDQLSTGSEEGWLKINFDSDRYAWVADQVRVSAPRVPQQPRQPSGPNLGGS